MTPILYVKRGCRRCNVAIDYLDERNIKYQVIDMRADAPQMQKLKGFQAKAKRRRWIGTERCWRISGSLNWSLFCAPGQPLQRHERVTRWRSLRQTH